MSDVADVRVDVVGVLRPGLGPVQLEYLGGGDVKLGRTRSVALAGLEGALVDVEADLVQGLPQLLISGLPDAACTRSRRTQVCRGLRRSGSSRLGESVR